MKYVSTSELKAKLSENLAKVREGETVYVTSHRRPVAEIHPVGSAEDPRMIPPDRPVSDLSNLKGLRRSVSGGEALLRGHDEARVRLPVETLFLEQVGGALDEFLAGGDGDVPHQTTSTVAGAIWHPLSAIGNAQMTRWCLESRRRFAALADDPADPHDGYLYTLEILTLPLYPGMTDEQIVHYGELLQTAGGKERMRRHFDEAGWPVPEAERDAFIRMKLAENHYYPPYFRRMEEVNQVGVEAPSRRGRVRILQ